MRISYILLLLLAATFCFNKSHSQKVTYRLIDEIPGAGFGRIDTIVVKSLSEPFRGITALYSAMAGTACDSTTCELTTALRLGDQGSDAHKALIIKYFPKDKLAKELLMQDCFLSPAGSSRFSEYMYLIISQYKDTIKVIYKTCFYDHGAASFTKGRDLYLFHNNHFEAIRRRYW